MTRGFPGRSEVLWWLSRAERGTSSASLGARFSWETCSELPSRTDVAIIGAGYTGLCAARALRQAGANVVVLEREHAGWGASGRNGGFILPGYKADMSDIVRRVGLPLARRLWDDSLAAIAFVEQVVREERIDCDFHRPGYVTLAAKPGHLRGLEASRQFLAHDFGYESQIIAPAELGGEITTARYHGGLLEPLAACVQPAAYVAGLAEAAVRAGATLVEGVGVTSLGRDGKRTRLHTTRGELVADEVLVATNGYSGTLLPWLARRVVPVGSFIVATEPIPEPLRRRLVPRGRIFADTKNLLYYFRFSPDGRLVFGGRAAFVPTALERSRTLLGQGIVEVFPELADTKIEYAWSGTLGFTLDHLPHAGRQDGITYALGYGGHGVALASWLGDQVGRAMAGKGPWPAITEIPFPAVPFFRGQPWFLPAAGAYYALKDWVT